MVWIRELRLPVTILVAALLVGVAGDARLLANDGLRRAAASSKSGRSVLYQETDFSGYWAHDAAASHVETGETLSGLGGGGAPEDLFISQARNGTLVVSSRHNPSQPRVYRIGSESVVPAPGEQGGTMRMSTRWRAGALVSEGSVTAGAETLHVREVLSLSDDGNTLVLEASLTGAAGVAQNRLVYRRWPGRGRPTP